MSAMGSMLWRYEKNLFRSRSETFIDKVDSNFGSYFFEVPLEIFF